MCSHGSFGIGLQALAEAKFKAEQREKKKRKKFAKSDQFAPELVYFAQCVRDGREPEPSGKEGLIDVTIIEAIHRSLKAGTWVDLRATPGRRQRPTLRQEIRRPAVPREPPLVQVESGHG